MSPPRVVRVITTLERLMAELTSALSFLTVLFVFVVMKICGGLGDCDFDDD